MEVYSWGGLTSRSKVRVLWLALLPFLFANLAGWMCPAATRNSAWKFRLHRLAAGLGGLALTVNAALIAVVISADVIAYQTARAGIALHQWWLAPLGWRFIAGHPGRQVMLGVLVPVLFVLALTWLASTTWRYEAVRPPYRVSAPRKDRARMATAAALPAGLADDEFWDGQGSVQLITWVHVAVTGGFLAVVLGVTARALSAGSPQAAALGWAAIGLGAATVVLGAGYVAVDALTTPPMTASAVPTAGPSPRLGPCGNALSDGLRVVMTYLRYVAAAALVLAGLFAWLQPASGYGRRAGLPGMAGLAGWTALAIAVALAIGLISMLLGLPGGKDTFKGAPWVTLMLGFGLLNILLLGAGIWVAHLVGPVTSDAAEALAEGAYLPAVPGHRGDPAGGVGGGAGRGRVRGWSRAAGGCSPAACPPRWPRSTGTRPRRSGTRRPGRDGTGTGRAKPVPPPGVRAGRRRRQELAAEDRPGAVPGARAARRHLAAVGHRRRAGDHGRCASGGCTSSRRC